MDRKDAPLVVALISQGYPSPGKDHYGFAMVALSQDPAVKEGTLLFIENGGHCTPAGGRARHNHPRYADQDIVEVWDVVPVEQEGHHPHARRWCSASKGAAEMLHRHHAQGAAGAAQTA